MDVIGLDIGHSTVKVAAGSEHIIFPTAATPAVKLSVAEAMDDAKQDQVSVNGKDYFVGRTALIHTNGNLLDGLRDDWIETDEHIALLVAGYKRGIRALGTDEVLLVLGLPSRLHARQKDRLTELAAMALQIDKGRIRVLPQALGAYMATVLDADGEPLEGRAITEERWGVVDIGYYTADFGLIDSGVWSAAGARSENGANQMATDLRERINAEKGISLSLRECDEILRTKTKKIQGTVQDFDGLVDECARAYSRSIVEQASQVFGERLNTLDGIIIAGGAGVLVLPHVKAAWPHATSAAAPRFAISEGLRRYGALQMSAKRAKSAEGGGLPAKKSAAKKS